MSMYRGSDQRYKDMAITRHFPTILHSVLQFRPTAAREDGSQLFASIFVRSLLSDWIGAVPDPSTMEKPVDLSGPRRPFRED